MRYANFDYGVLKDSRKFGIYRHPNEYQTKPNTPYYLLKIIRKAHIHTTEMKQRNIETNKGLQMIVKDVYEIIF